MPASGRTVIEEVKERLDIVELISPRAQLRRAGRNFKGLCPFHQEKTPSFVVFPDRQSYHCFGCGKSGDVVSFVMDTEGIDFKEALQQLASRAGVSLEQPKAVDPETQARESRLHEANRLAARYYNHLLTASELGAEGRKYLEGRGVGRQQWETWMLGYAPDSWDSTMKFMLSRGFTKDELFAVGLTVEGRGGGYYDRFRGRIMFPIRDQQGGIVAFGGRALGDATPKYLNSPESTLFVKGAQLYGLDLAQQAIKASNQAVVVEGYLDAIAVHAGGFQNAVATMGTALTPTQVRRLSKLTRNICLALDADAAGDTAAMRGWEVIRDSVSRRSDLATVHGRTVASGSRLDISVRIARLPRGEDPDTLIRRSPDEWATLIENARSVVDHFFTVVQEKVDLTTPEGRARALEELAPLVADMGNPIERSQYEARLAALVGLQQHEVHEVARSRRRTGPSSTTAYTPIQRVSPEEMVLALILRYPRLLDEMPARFADELERSHDRELYEIMRSIGSEALTPESLQAAAEGPMLDHALALINLLGSQPELLSNEQPEELRRRITLIRRLRLRELVHQHSMLLKEARDMGDEAGVRALLETVPALVLEMREFDPPRSPYFKDSREK